MKAIDFVTIQLRKMMAYQAPVHIPDNIAALCDYVDRLEYRLAKLEGKLTRGDAE